MNNIKTNFNMKKTKELIGIGFILIMIMGFVNSDEWLLFKSHGFKIEFPKKPDLDSTVVNSAIGKLKMYTFMYDASENKKDENLTYGVLSTEYPDSIVNSDRTDLLPAYFRNGIDGSVKNVQGKLLSEKTIELNGFPGREIKIDYKEGLAVIKMRLYLVKNKMYIIQTITMTKNEFNKSIDRFMDSFKLNN